MQQPPGHRYETYVKSFLLLFLLITASIETVVCHYLVYEAHAGHPRAIYAYQMAKIQHTAADDIETVFVGDSSLGHSLDARLFSTLTGSPSLNLALTGLYGYAGSYNMVKEVASTHQVKNVVLVHSLDMMTRKVAYDGYLYSANDLSDFTELTLTRQGKLLETALNNLLLWENIRKSVTYYLGTQQPRPIMLINDYPPQKQRPPHHPVELPTRTRINPQKTLFLKKLVQYCEQHDINLVVVHGPIMAEAAQQFDIPALNTTIAATEAELVDTLLFIPPSQHGDQMDHVHPTAKAAFTRRYADILQPYLLLRSDT